MKTVACVMVTSAKVFSWLGHMPVMNWSLERLAEVRGVGRMVCVASPALVPQATKLLAKLCIDVVPIPDGVLKAAKNPEAVLDAWLTSATGPAAEADVVAVVRPTSPLMEAGRIEACINRVVSGKATVCQPARNTKVAGPSRKAKLQEPVESVRVFKVAVPQEAVPVLTTVPVSLHESLDIDNDDEFVLVSALVEANKI